jgi:hypothetical protein
LKLSYRPGPAVDMNLDIHAFRTAQDGDLSSRRLAEEADGWVRYRFRQYLTLQGGFSLTWGGPALEELGRLEGRGEYFYFMTSLRF